VGAEAACPGNIAARFGREFPRQVDARAARIRIEHTTQHISGELPKENNDYERRAHTRMRFYESKPQRRREAPAGKRVHGEFIFCPGRLVLGLSPPFLKAAVLLKSRNSKVRELQKTQVASHHLLLTAFAL
jgi:hypothetical protein